ncbi:MAG: MBL fold metallo-hydrolase [Planctomycetes bacterium]|nr:MBL fold metallo-hydrolase [Planctomycetota bacterium]
MTRYLLALSACVALAVPAAAKEVLIKWHGQSFFEIKTSAGTVLAIDPHDLEAYGKRQVKADVVLVTHFHIDHCNFAQITNPRAKVIYGLNNKNKLGGDRKSDEFANVDETFKDVKIKSLGSYHDDVEGMKRGKNTIFILEVDGLRIVHLGDLGHELTPSLAKKIGTPDVLMVPIGGSYTLNGAEAKKVVAQLKPRRYIVPMHYGTKVYNYLVGPDEFLEDQPEKLVKQFKNNELSIDPEAVPRKDALIAMLSYEEK